MEPETLQQIAAAPHEEAAVAAFRVAFGQHPDAAAAEPHVRALAAAVRQNGALGGYLAGAFARLGPVIRDPKTLAAVAGVLGSFPGVAPYVGPIIGIISVLEGGGAGPAGSEIDAPAFVEAPPANDPAATGPQVGTG